MCCFAIDFKRNGINLIRFYKENTYFEYFANDIMMSLSQLRTFSLSL